MVDLPRIELWDQTINYYELQDLPYMLCVLPKLDGKVNHCFEAHSFSRKANQ